MAAYYQRRGFQPIKGDFLRLVMKVETARRALSTGRMTVSAQERLGVAGIMVSAPGGEAASVVASPDELRAIAVSSTSGLTRLSR